MSDHLVENNEIGKAERWLKSWCRVNTKKGDRRLLDVARALKRKEIVKLLEEYEHINEFVCATFACDLKRMMDILALGKGTVIVQLTCPPLYNKIIRIFF